MRPPSVGPDDDCHQDRSTQYTNSNSALVQNNSQQQPPKYGAWGDDINTISDEDVWFIFQNVNGITSSTGVHEAFKSKMVALGGTVTALAETNVNWQISTAVTNGKSHSSKAMHPSTILTPHVMKVSNESCNVVGQVWCAILG
jgi:hypothetical protein